MVSERELADLQTRVIRLRDDRTRMLVEHGEKVAALQALNAGLNARHLADGEAIAERDRRIAELEDVMDRVANSIRWVKTGDTSALLDYNAILVSLDAALAGKGVSRG